MARIARLIIYDGDELSLVKQMANSLPEGLHEKGKVNIMIIDLGQNPILNGVVQELTRNKERDQSMKKVFESNYGGESTKDSNLDLELRKIDLQSMVDR